MRYRLFFGLWPPLPMFSALPGAGNCLPFYGWGPTIYTQPRSAFPINLELVLILDSRYWTFIIALLHVLTEFKNNHKTFMFEKIILHALLSIIPKSLNRVPNHSERHMIGNNRRIRSIIPSLQWRVSTESSTLACPTK